MSGGAGEISDLAIEIIPENLPFRQAGNRHFRWRRSFACGRV